MMKAGDRMEKKLSIMEIERFAIHDGPGIRTTIFLQGCPLRCPWCANPETQQIKTHLMYFADKCISCRKCEKACKEEVVPFVNGKPVFDRQKGTRYQACADICPQEAIKFVGEKMSVTDIMKRILRDKDYYSSSGGGVTFSGGECFMQFEGLLELLEQCKKEGLHTAVETCGHVDIDKVKMAFPWIDLFLFDIKHTNNEILSQVTGGNLDIILKNLDYISSQDSNKIILRVPVLPGFNFEREILTEIFYMAVKRNIAKVHLLPYHTLGKGKYEQLGIKYSFPCDKMLAREDLKEIKEIGEDLGLFIQIGG